jgi:hypothetical protein
VAESRETMEQLCIAARQLEDRGQEVVLALLMYWGFRRKQALEIEYRLGILAASPSSGEPTGQEGSEQ